MFLSWEDLRIRVRKLREWPFRYQGIDFCSPLKLTQVYLKTKKTQDVSLSLSHDVMPT